MTCQNPNCPGGHTLADEKLIQLCDKCHAEIMDLFNDYEEDDKSSPGSAHAQQDAWDPKALKKAEVYWGSMQEIELEVLGACMLELLRLSPNAIARVLRVLQNRTWP